MAEYLHCNELYEKQDYSEKPFCVGEFDSCTFRDCNFSESYLSDSEFRDCLFESCDLSAALLKNSGLKSVNFTNCKIMGVDFSYCKEFLFEVNFEECILDYSIFLRNDLKNTDFKECSVKEAEFAECDLTGAQYHNCDLSGTLFSRCNLERADFTTAANYSLDPEINRLKGAKFSYPGITGLLEKYGIIID
jgi:uncharacterized protein YjbI with pentapeptide repeats